MTTWCSRRVFLANSRVFLGRFGLRSLTLVLPWAHEADVSGLVEDTSLEMVVQL